MTRCSSAALAPALLLLAACGGDDTSSLSSLPSDLKASLSLSAASISEDPDESVATLTVTLSSAVSVDVTATMDISGTAIHGLDYELERSRIRIEAGLLMASVRVQSVLDWIEEGPETATFSLDALNGQDVEEPGTVELVLEDRPVSASSKLIRTIEGPMLGVSARTVPNEASVKIEIEIENEGSGPAPETHAETSVRSIGDSESVLHRFPDAVVPALDPRQGHTIRQELDLSVLSPSGTYVLVARVASVAGGNAPEFRTATSGFGVAASGNVEVACPSAGRTESDAEDPLFAHQWSLVNTGQPAFAAEGGVAGADVGMSGSLDAGTSGSNVRVAIVDTGLELCHPDLADNVEGEASANLARWPGASDTDPFNPDVRGDHGTSVAGIIGAVADNGLGVRGVHPHALLRGYNFLKSDQGNAEPKSLGSSTDSPDSSDVDIFNMSWGQTGNVQSAHFYGNESIYEHGVNNLRGGKGAFYVKSAGNRFHFCERMLHDLRTHLGCRGSNNDTISNLSEVVLVGALSALGKRAPYSSTGANLWVSAPAGHYGSQYPAILTTDQAGRERGYEAYRRFLGRTRGLDDHALNPHGDYVSTFNGTSAAAPHVSGAIALLVAQHPELTWSDVRYILAASAKRVDPDLPGARAAINGSVVDFRLPWTRNAAGYWFHNWYGFGAVDIDSALDLADRHPAGSLASTERTEWHVNEFDLSIPDNDGAGIRSTIYLTGLDNARKIEAVELRLSLEHDFPSDLTISLKSPSGTTSLLVPPFNDVLSGVFAVTEWHQTTNAFYGEPAAGRWQLKVSDVEDGAVGEFLGWRIRIRLGDVPPASP